MLRNHPALKLSTKLFFYQNSHRKPPTLMQISLIKLGCLNLSLFFPFVPILTGFLSVGDSTTSKFLGNCVYYQCINPSIIVQQHGQGASITYDLIVSYFTHIFQAIKEALDTIQPSVDSADREKSKVLSNANTDQQTQIHKLIERLSKDWAQVNNEYKQRHLWVHCILWEVHPALVKQVHSRSVSFNFKWSVFRLTLSRYFTD